MPPSPPPPLPVFWFQSRCYGLILRSPFFSLLRSYRRDWTGPPWPFFFLRFVPRGLLDHPSLFRHAIEKILRAPHSPPPLPLRKRWEEGVSLSHAGRRHSALFSPFFYSANDISCNPCLFLPTHPQKKKPPSFFPSCLRRSSNACLLFLLHMLGQLGRPIFFAYLGMQKLLSVYPFPSFFSLRKPKLSGSPFPADGKIIFGDFCFSPSAQNRKLSRVSLDFFFVLF